jgi:hypothetical protein
VEQLNEKINKQQEEMSEIKRLVVNKSESIKSTQEKEEGKVSWGWKIAGGIGIGLVTFSSKFVETFAKESISGWKTAEGNKQKYYVFAVASIATLVTLTINVPTVLMLFNNGISLWGLGWAFVKSKWS